MFPRKFTGMKGLEEEMPLSLFKEEAMLCTEHLSNILTNVEKMYLQIFPLHGTV